ECAASDELGGARAGFAPVGDGTVFEKRIEREDNAAERSGEIVVAETLRSATQSAAAKKPAEKDEERVSLFWRVFGGTILSITALVAITLFNNMSSSITELRNDLSREREARAELVKKEDFQARSQSLYDRMRSAEALKADLEGLKERTNTNSVAIDGVKKDTAGLEVLRERLATVSADLKAARDEVQKLQQEVEKN